MAPARAMAELATRLAALALDELRVLTRSRRGRLAALVDGVLSKERLDARPIVVLVGLLEGVRVGLISVLDAHDLVSLAEIGGGRTNRIN